jgi:hypothetical protein
MAQNFTAADREQLLLLPPSLRNWLAEMNLEAFYGAYRADGSGGQRRR